MNTDITYNDVSIAEKIGITQQQYDFWKPYIELLDDVSHFKIQTYTQFPVVNSPFYSGWDVSSWAEGSPRDHRLNSAIFEMKKYRDVMTLDRIDADDIQQIVDNLGGSHIDNLVLNLLDKYSLCFSDSEHWKIIRKLWKFTVENKISYKAENWIKLFTMRKPKFRLPKELSYSFDVFRLSSEDDHRWTLNEKMSKFQLKIDRSENIESKINHRRVCRSQVLFYSNAQNIQEIFIL